MDKLLLAIYIICACIAFVFLTLAEYIFIGTIRRKTLLKNLLFSLSFSPIALIFGLIFCVIACKEEHKEESER